MKGLGPGPYVDGNGNHYDIPLNDGGAYNPTTNLWRPIATVGTFGHIEHTAVWTGTRMVIWGGWFWTYDDEGYTTGHHYVRGGFQYDPAIDHWASLESSPMPAVRGHGAVWTGSRMILWGGETDDYGEPTNDGAVYWPPTW